MREFWFRAIFIIFSPFSPVSVVLPILLILLSKINKNDKYCRLLVIPVGTTSIVIVGHFFGDPKGLNKFRWSRTKIRGTLYWELGVPNHPRNRWKWAKNDKNGSKSKFPRCPIFKFFVVIREVIPEKMAPISDSMNFFWVLSLLSHCGVLLKRSEPSSRTRAIVRSLLCIWFLTRLWN